MEKHELPLSVKTTILLAGNAVLFYGASLIKTHPRILYFPPIVALISYNSSNIYTVVQECRKWRRFAWKESAVLAKECTRLIAMFLLYSIVILSLNQFVRR